MATTNPLFVDDVPNKTCIFWVISRLAMFDYRRAHHQIFWVPIDPRMARYIPSGKLR